MTAAARPMGDEGWRWAAVCMSFGEIQVRIGEIQNRLLGLTGASPAIVGRASVGGAAAGSPGVQFAQALDAAVGAHSRPSRTGDAGMWVLPVEGEITSGFGPRWGTDHNGVDIAASTGTAVHAASGGVVKTASWYGGYGNAVIIDHGDGTSTLYGHNSKLAVRVGERVVAGQTIARVGSTGDSTGPHLHFEVRRNDKAVDPRPWLQARGVEI